MSQEVNVTVNFQTERAQKNAQKLDTDIKTLGDTSKASTVGVEGLTTKISAMGLALKGLGIGLIISAFVTLKSMLMENQTVMDKVSIATEAINHVFQKIVNTAIDMKDSIVSAFSNPKEAIKSLWESLKQNIVDRINGIIDSFKALGKIIKSAVSLDWDGVKEGAEDYGVALVQVATGYTEIEQTKFVETLKKTGQEIVKTAKEAGEYARKITELRNEVKLAEATQRGLQLQYQKEAEVQRQIRDDVSLTMEERIAANDELGRILDEQFAHEQELAQKKIDLAQMELDQNKSNIDLQVALINAKNEMADLDERITGQRSEQLVNTNSLLKEQEDLEKSLTEKTEKSTKQRMVWAEMEGKQKRDVVANTMGAVADLLGKESAAGKAMAIGQALINTYSAATAALAPPSQGGAGPILGPVFAALAIASGLKNVKEIMSTKLPYGDKGGGGGAGGTPSAPTMPSGIGGQALIPNLSEMGIGEPDDQQPVQAYVVENDISDAQALQQELDIQATL
tara:strand:+ start:8082 stop:9614 length:1533 start_codon:yes stop_codon:yes gene_type:complete